MKQDCPACRLINKLVVGMTAPSTTEMTARLQLFPKSICPTLLSDETLLSIQATRLPIQSEKHILSQSDRGLHAARKQLTASVPILEVARTCIRKLGIRMQFERGHRHISHPIDDTTNHVAAHACSHISPHRSTRPQQIRRSCCARPLTD